MQFIQAKRDGARVDGEALEVDGEVEEKAEALEAVEDFQVVAVLSEEEAQAEAGSLQLIIDN